MPSETIWFSDDEWAEVQAKVGVDGVENPSQAVSAFINEGETE